MQAIAAKLKMPNGSVSKILREELTEDERRQIEHEMRSKAQEDAELQAELLADLSPCGSPQCDDEHCEVEPGHCHCGCGKAVKDAKQTSRDERTVAGYPRMYHSQEHRGQSSAGVPHASTQRRLEEVGPCGCLQCPDPDCRVPPGRCHGCEKPAPLASVTSARENWAQGHPRMYCEDCVRRHNDAGRAGLLAANQRKSSAVRVAYGKPGGCGSWTCPNSDCSVRHGRCHYPGCKELAALPAQSRTARRWIVSEPALFCTGHAAPAIAGVLRDAQDDALLGRGLVPRKMAAGVAVRSLTGMLTALEYERVPFGGVVRLGYNAREVVGLSPEKKKDAGPKLDAGRKLAKPLSALNGTDFGRPPACFSKAELAMVMSLRSADARQWGWRALAKKLNEARPPDKQVSHMAVKRAFERARSQRPLV